MYENVEEQQYTRVSHPAPQPDHQPSSDICPSSVQHTQQHDLVIPSTRKHMVRHHPYRAQREVQVTPFDPSLYTPMSNGEDVCFPPEYLNEFTR